jgi:transcriptional regulator with XRE-family HTH domain
MCLRGVRKSMPGAFSKRIKDLRYKQEQSQEDLGVMLGKSRETISKYEKGEREPGIEVITKLASHFGVSTDYILGLSDDVNTFEETPDFQYTFDMNEFYPYFRDVKFVKYLKLAVKMADNGIDVKQVNEYIDNLIFDNKKKAE